MDYNLKVAYILHRFPYLTETFIMREMYWIRRKGVKLYIFSLLPPKRTPVHQQAVELLPHAHYSAFVSWEVIKAQFHFIRCSPTRYLKALVKTIWQTYREPRVLVRALIIFPKSVYFTRQMKKLGIDHIHAHFVWLEGIAAGIANDLLGITFTIQPHAFGLFGRNQRDVRCELQNASKVIAISKYHLSYIANLCPRINESDIRIVHCGLETDRFRPKARTADNNTIRILSVGRLIEKKGFKYLIDACALLAKRGMKFRCDIVGNGDQNPLQIRIDRHGLQDRVGLIGALDQNQVLKCFQDSDIFALPCATAHNGDRDGIPIVLMEAMACALPVISTAVSGIPELVKNGNTGLLVPDRDAASLAAAIERLILDEKLRQQVGRQARNIILEKFQIQQNVAEMADVFRGVKKERR